MNWFTKIARLCGWARCWGPNKHHTCPNDTWVRVKSRREWPLCPACYRWDWCELCGKWDPEEPPKNLRASDPRVNIMLCESCATSDKACPCGGALIKEDGLCWNCWDREYGVVLSEAGDYTYPDEPYDPEDPFGQGLSHCIGGTVGGCYCSRCTWLDELDDVAQLERERQAYHCCGCGRLLDETESRRCERCEEVEATAGEQQEMLLKDRIRGDAEDPFADEHLLQDRIHVDADDDHYIIHYQGRDYLLPRIDRDCVLAVDYDHRKFPEMLPEAMMQSTIERIIRRSYPTLFPDAGA